MMKRTGLIAALAMFCGTALFAQTYRDGFYFAQDAQYTDGQRNQVLLEVRGGRIAAAAWNMLSLNAGMQDLKTIARAGNVAAAVTWANQAKAAEDFLVSTQNVNASSVPNGPANVKPFFDLVKAALASTPVAKGMYTKDGWYYALHSAADEYNSRNYVLITVVNGTVVDVLWNAVLQNMPPSINLSKIITSTAGRYPMRGTSPWHVQAALTSRALVAAQNPDSIRVRPDGRPDAISGVTILVNHFIEVSKTALQSAR